MNSDNESTKSSSSSTSSSSSSSDNTIPLNKNSYKAIKVSII
jgi:hypothetical protein